MKHINDIFRLGEGWDSQNFNLHNHTTFSDGENTVDDLCELANTNTVTHLSITDHDSIDAYTKGDAIDIWEDSGLEMIPWVEATLKTQDDTKKVVHMLLYFDRKLITDKQFIKDISDTIGRVRSDEVMKERIKAYNSDLGINLSIEDFEKLRDKWGFPWYSRWKTAKLFKNVIREKYPDIALGDLSKVISPKREDYIQPWLEVSEMLYLKNKYDLSNVLAHPFRNKIVSLDEIKELIGNLTELWELDGLETYYPWHTREEERTLKDFNTRLYTWGSDTHTKSGKWSFMNMNISNILNKDFERLSRKWDLWVMVGRMNPPHIGHIRVIKKAIKENGRLIFFLWSANKQDKKNPFSCEDRFLFLETYFKQEIEREELIIQGLDDVGDYPKWVKSLWSKVKSHYPCFKWKVNIYWWDLKQDRSIEAISDHLEDFPFDQDKVSFREIPREDFWVNHNGKHYEVSSTALRFALEEKDFELAKKLMPREIADLVLTKWKEIVDESFWKKMFFLYPPKKDKQGSIHRNYHSGNKIKQKIDRHFHPKHIVDEVKRSDVIVPVWWDGTLLYAIKQYWYLWKPFYPIASGTKNFIPAQFTHPYQLLTEDKEVFTFTLLEASFYSKNGELISQEFALNDVYLEVEQGTVGTLTIKWDEYPKRIVRWNGLIVSTPIWSTAYNKNAWGNILPLENNVLSVTDIASEKGISDVVNANQTFVIKKGLRSWNFAAYADGTRIDNIHRVVIKNSQKQVQVILPKDNNFRKNRYR